MRAEQAVQTFWVSVTEQVIADHGLNQGVKHPEQQQPSSQLEQALAREVFTQQPDQVDACQIDARISERGAERFFESQRIGDRQRNGHPVTQEQQAEGFGAAFPHSLFAMLPDQPPPGMAMMSMGSSDERPNGNNSKNDQARTTGAHEAGLNTAGTVTP